jgi:hypothetical protein
VCRKGLTEVRNKPKKPKDKPKLLFNRMGSSGPCLEERGTVAIAQIGKYSRRQILRGNEQKPS